MNNKTARYTRGIVFYLEIITIIGFFSAITIFLCAIDKYFWLALLPLSFCVLSWLFNGVYRLFGKSITVTLLVSLMFFKNIIIPFTMTIGNGYFPAHVDTAPKMLPAVLLLIYEEVVVFVLLYYRLKKLDESISNSHKQKLTEKKDAINTFSCITLLLLFVAIVCLWMYPQLESYIKIGVSGDISEVIKQARLEIAMKETVPTLFFYAYTLTVNILRWILPAMIIFNLYSSKKKEITKILISFFAIGLSVIMTTGTVAVSVFIALAYSLLLCKLYPLQRKSILIFSILFVFVAGFIVLFVKTFGYGEASNATFGDIAYMFQAYFSGPENVAVALQIDTSTSFSEMTGDVLRFVPYLMYFFKGLPSSNVVFNQTYWGNQEIANQIIPMISQGARHFTVFFAPVYTAIITGIAMKWEINATKKEKLLDYTICAIGCVCLSMSVVMYNASLCLQMFLNYILPIQFIIWFSKRIKRKG